MTSVIESALFLLPYFLLLIFVVAFGSAFWLLYSLSKQEGVGANFRYKTYLRKHHAQKYA